MTLLRRRVTALGFAVCLLAAGCGDDQVTSAQRDRLSARIDEAREAAGGRDADGVRRALASFRASVGAARERGEISTADAERLLDAALAASRRARAEITPEPTPEPTPVPTTAPAPPVQEPEGKGQGKKDKEKDDGDD